MVRGKHAGVGDLFQGSGSVGSYLWVIYMGGEPPYWFSLGGFLEHGGLPDHRKVSIVVSGWKFIVPPIGGGNIVEGFGGGGGVRLEEA